MRNRRRRIALLSEHASPLAMAGGVDSGGQNIYVSHVARQLASLGHDVDVITRKDSPDLPEVMEWNGIRVVHIQAGPPGFVRKEDLLAHMDEFTARFSRFARFQRPGYDLIHANFWMSGLVAAEIRRRMGIPFVVTFHALGRVRRRHQGASDAFSNARFEIEDRIVREADHLIPECPQDEADLTELYGAPRNRMTMVPCGFDPAELWPMNKAVARSVLGIDPSLPVFLQLGRIVPRKGVDTVISGFAELRRRHRIDAQLLVVGGETEMAERDRSAEMARLRKLAADEGVASGVKFIGRRGRETLKYFYSAADVFVTMPWYEPFGITPVESMACGTPVIGADVGGIRYTVVEGKTGYLVPPHNPGLLADRMAHLCRNPELLRRFRHESIRRVNSHFTWAKVGEKLADLYERILGARMNYWRDAQ